MSDAEGRLVRFPPPSLVIVKAMSDLKTQIDLRCVMQIPPFLKVRAVGLYILLRRFFGDQVPENWGRDFVNGRRERIEGDVAVLDIDFAAL